MLIENCRNDRTGILIAEKRGDRVDRKSHLAQKIDRFHSVKIGFRIKMSPAIGKLAQREYHAGIVILNVPDRNAAKLRDLYRGVFGHGTHFLCRYYII